MATTKIADIAIKVGEYEKDGQTKGEYENIGALMQSDDGGEFLLINNSALNPSLAMIANKERKRRIAVSIFREREEQTTSRSTGARSTGNSTGGSRGADTDQIPFAPLSRRIHF